MFSLAINLLCFALFNIPSWANPTIGPRDVYPNMPYDGATTKYCTWWHDNYEGLTCEGVMSFYSLKLVDFVRWNPSLTASGTTCIGWQLGLSYCVDAYTEPKSSTSVSSKTSTTTSKPSTTTTAVSTVTPVWTKIGCFLDSVPNTLATRFEIPGGYTVMTTEACQATCWSNGYTYAGLEYSWECWCGNSIRNEIASDAATACGYPCSGNNTQVCGGSNRIIVYEGKAPTVTTTISTSSTSKPATPTSTATPIWNKIGCFLDYDPQHTLATRFEIPGGYTVMTTEVCQATCWNNGYTYAGLEYSWECWCGNSINNEIASDAATACGYPCSGNNTQVCGGSNRIIIYEGKVPKSTDSWSLLGCYEDLGTPHCLDTFGNVTGGRSMNSVTACQTVCKASGNLFSGVENADECWCGNVIHGAAKDQVDCGKACTGNSAQICGGVSRISIYQLTDVSPKWIRLGCYTDNSTARTLSHTVPATVLNTTTTNALCIKECQLFGYTYAGTEAGSQCYCGKAIQNAGVPAPEGASGCSTVCKGNATDTCGGTNRLTLSYLLS